MWGWIRHTMIGHVAVHQPVIPCTLWVCVVVVMRAYAPQQLCTQGLARNFLHPVCPVLHHLPRTVYIQQSTRRMCVKNFDVKSNLRNLRKKWCKQLGLAHPSNSILMHWRGKQRILFTKKCCKHFLLMLYFLNSPSRLESRFYCPIWHDVTVHSHRGAATELAIFAITIIYG